MTPARRRTRASMAGPKPAAKAGPKPGVLHFEKGWHQSLSAPIQRGQALRIMFDPERLPHCRLTMRGAEFWDVLGHIRCHPGGQLYEHSMLEPIRATPTGPVVALQPVLFELSVPVDTTALELWFENVDTYYRTCRTWDSDFGRNYSFDVEGAEPQPRENVAYRLGAVSDLAMINVTGQHVRKDHAVPAPSGGPRVGSDIQTKLGVSAWVRNLAYDKRVWVDLHVFDEHDVVIQRQTLPLQWQMPSGGDGDGFGLEATVHPGSTATPGSVSPRADARKLQYRLYCEMSRGLYTDGIAHEHQLPEDAVVT